MSLAQTYKDVRRLQQIANVLFRQELGYFVDKLNLKAHLPFEKRLHVSKFAKPKDSTPKRLRLAMEELGGSFVKLGQLLSLRPDLVPQDYLEEFSKLQDEVKPFPFDVVKMTVESELGSPLKKIFSFFNEKPVAAASVGQVHEAILKNGQRVAVKVQRPGIREVFETDIDLMYHLARLLEKHIPESKSYSPTGIVEEFEKYTQKEMDYVSEAKNIERYQVVVEDQKHVVIPKVYWDFTTSKVLTMEFIDGVKISSIKDFRKLKVDGDYLSGLIARIFVKSVLYHNIFHADPHPGNIMLLKNKNIALLDFGITGQLTPELTEKVFNLYMGLVNADVEMITEGLVSMGFISDETNKEKFKEEIRETWSKYYDTTLKQFNMSSFFWETINMGRKYGMRFSVEYVLLIKAMVTTEGVVQKINPGFNFVKVSRPMIEKLIKERTSPEYLLKSAKKTLMDFKNLLVRFPVDAQKILTKLEKEEPKELDICDADMKKFETEIERSSNRMTLGIVMASLIVASALVMLAKIPPFVGGLPLYSLIGLIIAGILLIVLIISALK
ncbi:MAG: AarF/ABC1/UbiB kinase family protein [Nanoarchaeota archaeon]|nr:AarF/ABC1/UbiB kinase family protein [Nanoarchaeota archaeon]